MLARHQAEPRRQVTAGLEDRGVADRRRQCCRGDRADAGNRHQPLTHRVLPGLFGQPGVQLLDPPLGVAQLIDQTLEDLPGQRWNPRVLWVGHHGSQLRDLAGALGRYDAELGQVSAQRVDQLCLLGDQRLAHPMERQGALLLLGLDRHEPHARPLDRLADRFGIGSIVLLALHVSLDVLRRHQAHRVAEPGELSRPKVRPGTRLHPDHANGQVGEKRQHRIPAQPLRHNHLAVDVNAVNLEHRLRQIKTDECRRHRAISVMRVTYPSCGTTWPDAEAVHPITLTHALSQPGE